MSHITRGFTVDGLHSYHDIGVIIPTDPQIYYPSKIKMKERILGTNKIYDVSELVPGIQPFEERKIKFTINIIDFDKIDSMATQAVASRVMNWLYGYSGPRRVDIDIIPEDHWMVEFEEGNDFETNLLEFGIAEVVGTAYPYRISNDRIGDDVFMTFDFIDGLRHITQFRLPANRDQLPFKVLADGDKTYIGAWAQNTGGVASGPVNQRQLNTEYTIASSEVRPGDTVGSIVDRRLYTILEEPFSLWAQDLVAVREPLKVSLNNPGRTSLLVDVVVTYYDPSTTYWKGVTILYNGRYYPMVLEEGSNSTRNDSLMLQPGENELEIFGADVDVSFYYREEKL